ncbi:MAG TPA: DUF3365 domain-containing protein [Hyphomonadaceae bacterium]|nr:DUF3365 domain-containing protein [Hyphomonadaceae bacterium]
MAVRDKSGFSIAERISQAALAGLMACAWTAGCTPKKEVPDPSLILAARRAAVAFDYKYKTDILDRLERDEDPVAVYQAYRDNVPGYAKDISQTLGLDFRRIAQRVRNPNNAADDWESEQMDLFKFLIEAGIDPSTLETAEIVKEGKERVFRWIRPMVMGDQCMTCHGDNIDPKILTLLKQEYPLDEATGYFLNEIGGAYSVRISLDPK